MKYQMKYVYGHVEVYDDAGVFLFSADTMREAQEDMEEWLELQKTA